MSNEPQLTPAPTDEEAAAIMAATEALWPRPTPPHGDHALRVAPWRFSGRWWSKPIPVRRIRPWH